MDKCERKDTVNIVPSKIDSIKAKTDTIKVEVEKLKEGKTKFIYRTKFDTITVEKVLIELQKCDTIVKIDSVIIAKQDTIIKGQEEIITELHLENAYLEKDFKKQKRKLLVTKIIAGVVIFLTILASR